jgi:flagellar motor switch protein FliN/FliY
MAELTPETVDLVVQTCQAAAEEVAAAVGRALDVEVTASVGEPGTFDPAETLAGMDGPGLAIVLTVDQSAAVFGLPESSSLLPAWYVEPDKTGRAKLDTLAQELGELLLPEGFSPRETVAVAVADLQKTLSHEEASSSPVMITIEFRHADGRSAIARLIWPAAHPAGSTPKSPSGEAAARPESRGAKPSLSRPPRGEKKRHAVSVHDLPYYTRSLLRIKVPVVVTLARKQQSLGRVLELGPGAIIQFDKSYEEMLDLDVGGRRVATGEAVKVGEKFGLRITFIVLPGERFRRVERAAANPAAGSPASRRSEAGGTAVP